jgi:hypothetical protein
MNANEVMNSPKCRNKHGLHLNWILRSCIRDTKVSFENPKKALNGIASLSMTEVKEFLAISWPEVMSVKKKTCRIKKCLTVDLLGATLEDGSLPHDKVSSVGHKEETQHLQESSSLQEGVNPVFEHTQTHESLLHCPPSH